MKLKTKKSVAKRFKFTKNKRIKYKPAGKSHLLTKKNSSKIRQLRKLRELEDRKAKKLIRRLLPYG